MDNEPQGKRWTLQQFCTIARRPWYALQEQTDAGIVRQFTGYRHELETLARQMNITPEELPPITEQEFFRRQAEALPEDGEMPMQRQGRG